jgi:hypothetical protein
MLTRNPRTIPEAIDSLRFLCGSTLEPDPICFRTDVRGTVSSTIVSLSDDPESRKFIHAQGPPDQTEYVDMSILMTELMASPKASSGHRIRLRDPWIRMASEGSKVVFSRNFGKPGKLDPAEIVLLMILSEYPIEELKLNGMSVNLARTGDAYQANITARLEPRNRIEFLVEGASEAEEIPFEAMLLIQQPEIT